MSRKVFTAGEVLAAADVNSFLMDQTVMSFAGTAARGSAIPTPTTGMYTHIEDSNPAPRLQFWNGSAWRSPLGQTLIATSTFTSQTSITFDNIFTSEFRAYDYYFTAIGSGAFGVNHRLRVGGADLSTSTYFIQTLGAGGASVSASSATIDAWNPMTVRTTGYASLTGTIVNPFVATQTQLIATATDSAGRIDFMAGNNTNSASYDGIRFFLASGTMTGNVAIYGRRN
jgi:hypothetical protein